MTNKQKICRTFLILSVVFLILLIGLIFVYNRFYSEEFTQNYRVNLGAGALKKINCRFGLRGCTITNSCRENDIRWCTTGTLGCEDNSAEYCEPENLIEQHVCRDGKQFFCKSNEEGCYDYSVKFCKENSDDKDVTKSCMEDGKIVSHFHCKEKDPECRDNSKTYCKNSSSDKPKKPKKAKYVAEVTKKCKDGTSFNCWENEPGCFSNSMMYCPGGDTWCSSVGGSGYPVCKFDDWNSCVKAGGCVTDPAEAHPGWYDITKSKNDYDRMQVVANGGENAMTIYDECNYHNTNWNRNPRCMIDKGPYKGEVGVCRYDGVNVQKCQPVGQNCENAVPSYCNKEQELMLGQSRKVNPMCIRNGIGDVYMDCV
mgnify:CR=1 FL=1